MLKKWDWVKSMSENTETRIGEEERGEKEGREETEGQGREDKKDWALGNTST